MNKRRQPTGQFFHRLKNYSEPKPKPDPEVKPDSWIRKFHGSDGWLWAEVFAFVAVLATIWQIWIDLEDRQTQRIAQAWELVTRPAPGNAGKVPALEYLNSQGIPLIGINLSTESNHGQSYLQELDLSGAFLAAADLSGADLRRANLSRANLTKVDLSEANLWNADLPGANLEEADLSGANLGKVDLSGANLRNVDLSGANLWKANLSGANLWKANLSGAFLSHADLSAVDLRRADLSGANLTKADLSEANLQITYSLPQERLDSSCGDEKTILPARLTIQPCPDEDE